MPKHRSNWWVLLMAPTLLFVTGCGTSNENNIDTKNTTTSPDATDSTEELLKRAAKPAKRVVPPGYPR